MTCQTQQVDSFRQEVGDENTVDLDDLVNMSFEFENLYLVVS